MNDGSGIVQQETIINLDHRQLQLTLMAQTKPVYGLI